MLLQKLIFLLNKSHFCLSCAQLSHWNFYRDNNLALCNNLEYLPLTW